MKTTSDFIAKRFRSIDAGLSLDTEALARYNDVIDLSIGDTDFITDDAIIDAAFHDAKAGYTHYGNPMGDPELIHAVCAAWQEDFRQPLTPDHVLITASSCLGMALVMMSILDPGDEVIVFSPYFSLYRNQIELAGGVCVEVPTYAEESWAVDEARLRAAITPKTKAIIFNNPCNPTGMGYERKTLELLGRVAEEHDLLIAADEIYTTYLYEGEFIPIRTLPGLDRTGLFRRLLLCQLLPGGVQLLAPALHPQLGRRRLLLPAFPPELGLRDILSRSGVTRLFAHGQDPPGGSSAGHRSLHGGNGLQTGW